MDTSEWLKEELDKQEEARRNAIASRGGIPFFKAPVGESMIEIDRNEVPEDRTSGFGKAQKAFKVNYEGNEFLFTISVNSPMYRDILKIMKDSPTDIVKVKVIRTGSGQQTRYTILPAD
mgnify:CR=1 FL=1